MKLASADIGVHPLKHHELLGINIAAQREVSWVQM
jgi:hypothetical protein